MEERKRMRRRGGEGRGDETYEMMKNVSNLFLI